MFNSALIYELAVLKPYAESILFGIPKDVPEYVEAKRLLKFLVLFYRCQHRGDSKELSDERICRRKYIPRIEHI